MNWQRRMSLRGHETLHSACTLNEVVSLVAAYKHSNSQATGWAAEAGCLQLKRVVLCHHILQPGQDISRIAASLDFSNILLHA